MPQHLAPPLWQLSLTTAPETAEALTTALGELLQQPVAAYHDARKTSVELSVYLTTLPWPTKRLKNHVRETLRHTLRPSPASLRLRLRRLPARNWAEAWKRHFKPFSIGTALLVRPSWSTKRPTPGQRVVTLDPGLSFGTGHHPTTRFCLEGLVACRVPGQAQAVLDIGTGSGLLAIAAARLGYQPVRAFDNDAGAVRTAEANARRNRAAKAVSFECLDLARLPRAPRKPWDVTCANLTADLLLREAERIAAQVRPGGSLLLAGILRRELRSVRERYQPLGFRPVRTHREGEWGSIWLRRIPVTDL